MSMFDKNAITKARPDANDRDLARIDQALSWQRYVLGDDKAAEALKFWCWCEATAMEPLPRGDLRIQGRGRPAA